MLKNILNCQIEKLCFLLLFLLLTIPLSVSAQSLCGTNIQCLPYQDCNTHLPTNTNYCADNCSRFSCPRDSHCELVNVFCVTSPCPPIARCFPDDPQDTCSLPPETGDCNAAIERWYFNQTSGRCETFLYGGCGGNVNNFTSESACRASCTTREEICALPSETGPCDAAIPRWWFNQQSGQCESFIYGGCQGNGNNFQTQPECQQFCGSNNNTCTLAVDPGPCHSYIPRWYYDERTNTCERFIYGGCGGNSNNFLTAAECSRSCQAREEPCQQPQVRGPCDAAIVRWWFNTESGECEQFIYGGCGGNANNFSTLNECRGSCGGTEPCKQAKQPGQCNAAIQRWWHNPDTKVCESFIYSGCGGNSNNFATVNECTDACSVETCKQPIQAGPCSAVIPRWGYNSTTGQCEKFHYGGCGGNDNNFLTLDACRLECPPLVCENPCQPHQNYKVDPLTGIGYCADTCNGFNCPSGQYCELIEVSCIEQPCPPVARCIRIPPVCPPVLPGDFNLSGTVDGRDFLLWQRSFGQTVTPGDGADGNCDGMIDNTDLTIWRDNYATSLGSGGSGSMQNTGSSLISGLKDSMNKISKKKKSKRTKKS